MDKMLENGVPTRLGLMAIGAGEQLQAKANEAAARGYYKLPEAHGPNRRYKLNDLVGLVVLRDLLRLDLRLPHAASRAGLVRDLLQDMPQAKVVTLNFSAGTETLWSDAHGELHTNAPVTLSLRFEIETIRGMIRDGLTRVFDADAAEFERLWRGPLPAERAED